MPGGYEYRKSRRGVTATLSIAEYAQFCEAARRKGIAPSRLMIDLAKAEIAVPLALELEKESA